jgi:hypothetical protein
VILPRDHESKSLPSTGSSGIAPSAGAPFAQRVSYQQDSSAEYGGAEADRAEADAFAEKFGIMAPVLPHR